MINLNNLAVNAANIIRGTQLFKKKNRDATSKFYSPEG